MSLVKRREKCGKVRKIQTPRMYKRKLKSQLDMRAQWPKKLKHNKHARLHNNTLNTKFIELRGIMKSVIGAFHNTFRTECCYKGQGLKLNSMILNFKGVHTLVFDPFLT